MFTAQFGEPYPPTIDGVGQVMYAYCRFLPKLGHRSVYVAPKNGDPDAAQCEKLLYPGLRLGRTAYRVGFPLLHGKTRRALRALPLDIVHAHSPFMSGHAARRIARRKGIPLVATFHSKYYDDALRATHSQALARFVVRYVVDFYDTCDEVWAVNQATADVLREYGYRGPLLVMENGTDMREADQAADAQALRGMALREDVPTLLFVGQQDIKKNTEGVLRACALLRKMGEPFQLIMVGEGQDRHHLERLADDLGISGQTRFTGAIRDRALLMALYRRADLFVFPSLYDNAPMVVREAASEGTPSLLVRGSCAAEGVRHGENGYLCEDSPESIARGILEALPTCEQTGAAARETIPLSWDEVSRRVVERYEDLCAKKRAGRGGTK